MIVTSNIPQAVAALAELQVVMKAATEAMLVKTAEKAHIILSEGIRAKTPVGKTGGTHLRDTGEHEIAYGPGEAILTERQTKTIPIRGQGVPLAMVLRTGRNEIPLPGETLKRPLKTPWGPRWHVKKADPNPYAAEAAASAMPVVIAAAERIAASTVQAGVREALR